jgi:hypothetical protein
VRESEQLVFGSLAEVSHRRMNSTSAPRDLHVSNAGGTHLLLFVAGAAKDCMRVRIDEARREDAPAAVDRLSPRPFFQKIFLLSDGGYFVAFNSDGET